MTGKSEFQRVYTMTDYHDGPLTGVADYQGRPHIYERAFNDEEDEYEDVFRLQPIDKETLGLALEAWDRWKRWEAAWQRGDVVVSRGQPAVLPADRQRYEELAAALKSRLVLDASAAIRARGEFRTRASTTSGEDEVEVRWTAV